MEQPPVQIGQYILGKNLGIGAFGKVRMRLCLVIGVIIAALALARLMGIYGLSIRRCAYPVPMGNSASWQYLIASNR